jgi:ATP-dependent DNA helicase RecG
MTAATQPQTSPAVKPFHPLLAEYPRLPGMNPQVHEKLRELCGPRWLDLLLHLPRNLLDRSQTPTIAEAQLFKDSNQIVTIQARVLKRPPLPRAKVRRPVAIDLSDDTAPLRAIFFNPHNWIERAFPVGGEVIISGKLEADAKGKKIIHPDVWALTKNRDLGTVARLTPLYPGTAGLAQGWLNRAMLAAQTELAAHHSFPPLLPPALADELPPLAEALGHVHNPASPPDLLPDTPARRTLAFHEFLAAQVALRLARADLAKHPGIAHGTAWPLTEKFLKALPWPLTPDQRQALDDIRTDLHRPRPMLRLLQGDVGAGKTVVALLALLHVIENGQQGVLMAPTEILARQHYATALKWLTPLGVTVALLTGRTAAAEKKKLKNKIRGGFVNLLIGTHALVQDDVVFDKLGLAVIDEQHRFGVKQRLALSANQQLPPDMLVMTATPIPRTLALTIYGDMDMSVIKTKPPGRSPIKTSAVPLERLGEISASLQRVIENGQQVYWVCPLIDESEELDLAAATARFESLQRIYGGQVALLHGSLKPADKLTAMSTFQTGEKKILVTTTVIEVGVDVPNASVMVIEHAERFGLSQLHQLRGRVGRGAAVSSCILLYQPPLGGYAQSRLNALRQSDDGFFLAEEDLRLRGPGEMLGTRQSGEWATRVADLHAHRELLPVARDQAERLLNAPPSPQKTRALTFLLEMFNHTNAIPLLRSG